MADVKISKTISGEIPGWHCNAADKKVPWGAGGAVVCVAMMQRHKRRLAESGHWSE